MIPIPVPAANPPQRGGGHTQRPGAGCPSLRGLLEVLADLREPAAYAARFNADHLPFDFVWFTPRVDNQDPCEKFATPLRDAGDRHLKQRKPSE